MEPGDYYSLAADTILVLHVLFVLFVVVGLLLVYLGKFLSWAWVRNPWFRVLHLLAIAYVVVQTWFDAICPLTIWEMELRAKAGVSVYDGPFIVHWLSELLFFQAPAWVFTLCYTVFGGLVLISWFLVRPRAFTTGGKGRES